MKADLELLYKYKYLLTRQQFSTFKGQILSGDINGFHKGLTKLMQRRCNNGTPQT
jgi:hypothetical protein